MVKEKMINDSWNHHMRNGDFESAWQKSDENLALLGNTPTWHLPRHQQTIWRGASLKGKHVLVRCYHGLGDTIQFARFLPLLQQEASTVTLWAQEPLIPLLQTTPGIDVLLPLSDSSPACDYGADIEIMELPHYFRTTVDTIPANIPYLHAEPLILTNGDKPTVGVVWKPGEWDPKRCVPFEELAPLATIEGIELIILQADVAAAGWQPGFGTHPGEFNLANYARVLAGIDLLVSVDSMPVHLAGALGKPVFTLLHSEADWRWMNNRTDSPWYPTMRLFRQPLAGDWKPVVQEVIAAIGDFVAKGL